jgi:PKD repeat protein
MKIGERFIVIVVLCLLLVFSTTIGAVEKTNTSTNENNDTLCDCNKIITDTYVKSCTCTLLNGKYAVMNERTPEPKTNYDFYENPAPSPSYYNDIPSQFSWKDYGGDWTTPAKDQGNCGSCWAFSGISTMEAAINIASGYPDTDIDLSEQYILSCLPYGGSCSGGWTDDCFESIISTDPTIGNGINGVCLESCMPYQANDWLPCDDKCPDWDVYSAPPEETDILWQMESWGANHNLENDDPNDRDIVKGYIMDYGPLSASMYATSAFSSYWDTHHNPDDWYYEEDYPYTNHAVLLLGWKDDASVTNGGYWILKNSWGTSWGYDGFFNVAYGGLKIGEIVRWCITPEWGEEEQGPGPIPPVYNVFAGFSYGPSYPRPGDTVQFNDESQGFVTLWEWDFNSDGVVDSNKRNPTWVFSEEGDYSVTLTVWSQSGLHSNITLITGVKEIWPPVAVTVPIEFAGKEITIQFEGRYSYDVDGHIVSYFWDFDDNGETSSFYNPKHTFSTKDKIYNVALTVTDDEGASSTKICPVKIDYTVPPETVLYIQGCDNLNIWFQDKVKVELFAEDWTNVAITMYKINDGEWQQYKSPFNIQDEGINTVYYYSTDGYGNVEDTKTQDIKIDKTPPTINFTLDGEQSDGWFITPITVTLSGSDEFSDVEKIVYEWDSAWYEYSEPFTVLNDKGGVYYLQVIVIDLAGNDIMNRIPIGLNPPPNEPEITGQSSRCQPGVEYEYSFVSTDFYLGDILTYYVDWGDGTVDEWTKSAPSGEEITAYHIWNEQKEYTIKSKAKDDLGAESDWGTLHISMPKNKMLSIFYNFLEKHPILYDLLRYCFLN